MNSARKAVHFLVYDALPPRGTKVLWMDISVPSLPVLKIFWNGQWIPVHTDNTKTVELITTTINSLSDICNNQENTINVLTDTIKQNIVFSTNKDVEEGKENIANALLLLGVQATKTDSFKALSESIKLVANIHPVGSILLDFTYPNNIGFTDCNLSGIRQLNTSTLKEKFARYNYLKYFKVGGILLCPYCTSIASMFNSCDSIVEVDLRGLDTSQVTDMNWVFGNCPNLSHVNMAGLDTRKVKSVVHLFGGNNTTKLEWIDMTGFDCTSLIQSDYMFYFTNSNLYTLVGDTTIEEVYEKDIKIFNNCNLSLNFRQAAKLNRASVVAIFKGVADLTGKTSQTLAFTRYTYDLLTSEDLQIVYDKNWTIIVE